MEITATTAGSAKLQSDVGLADVTQTTASNMQRQDILSEISQKAFSSFANTPGTAAKEADLKAEMLSESQGNKYLPEDLVPQKPEALSDQFITKMSSLYNEVTVYQVAWNMAKRTGRNIETLLRGQ